MTDVEMETKKMLEEMCGWQLPVTEGAGYQMPKFQLLFLKMSSTSGQKMKKKKKKLLIYGAINN